MYVIFFLIAIIWALVSLFFQFIGLSIFLWVIAMWLWIFIYSLKSFNLLLDIKSLYKNFIHWNISKILIYLSSILLGLLLAIPFLILMLIIWYIDPINWNGVLFSLTSWASIDFAIYSSFYENIAVFLLQIFIFIMFVSMLLFWYSYKIILFSKLNLAYINWSKLPYKNNDYFNWKLIWAYFWTVWWAWLVIFIPVFIFLLIFTLLVVSFWWPANLMNYWNWDIRSFGLILFILFIITIISVLYLSYRVSFSFINIVDANRFPEIQQKTKFYLKDSFKISKWLKIFKFWLVLLILFVLLLPFSYVWDFLITNFYVSIVYIIFMFVIFKWLFEMIIVSLYKRVMLENNSELVFSKSTTIEKNNLNDKSDENNKDNKDNKEVEL